MALNWKSTFRRYSTVISSIADSKVCDAAEFSAVNTEQPENFSPLPALCLPYALIGSWTTKVQIWNVVSRQLVREFVPGVDWPTDGPNYAVVCHGGVDRYGNHVFSSFSYVGARLFRYFVEKNEFQEITRARNTFLYFDYESCFAMGADIDGAPPKNHLFVLMLQPFAPRDAKRYVALTKGTILSMPAPDKLSPDGVKLSWATSLMKQRSKTFWVERGSIELTPPPEENTSIVGLTYRGCDSSGRVVSIQYRAKNTRNGYAIWDLVSNQVSFLANPMARKIEAVSTKYNAGVLVDQVFWNVVDRDGSTISIPIPRGEDILLTNLSCMKIWRNYLIATDAQQSVYVYRLKYS